MFWCKTYSIRGEFVVAICDECLLGKKIGKNVKINIKKDFYGGELVDEEKVFELIKKSSICNLLGKETIKIAIEKKFITKENIILIDDIPHAQLIK